MDGRGFTLGLENAARIGAQTNSRRTLDRLAGLDRLPG